MTIHADLPRTDPGAAAPPFDVPVPAPTPPVSMPPVSPPPVDPLAIGALVAALPAPPVGVALGIVALRRIRTGEWRGTGLAVAGLVAGGVLTAFWVLVATLMVMGIVAGAAAPASSPVPASTSASSPAPNSAPTPAPAPAPGDAGDPGIVSATEIEQQLARATGLPTAAITCPSELSARAEESETCSAELPGRGAVPVVVSVTSVHGEDVGLRYQLASSAT